MDVQRRAATLLAALVICGSATAQPGSSGRLDHLLKAATTQLVPLAKGNATFTSFRDDRFASSSYGVELCVLRIPARAGRLGIKDARTQASPRDAYERLVPPSAIGAVTGGFFGLDGRGAESPLGLVKTRGRVTNKRHGWTSGGVLFATKAGPVISPIGKFKDSADVLEAVQSKPLLVESGKNGIRSNTNDRFDRSAVALAENGDYVMAVIHAPAGNAASLAEFSRLLLALYRLKDKRLSWAIAMDGGPGAHLFVPKLKRHCGNGTPNYIPNIVYVSP